MQCLGKCKECSRENKCSEPFKYTYGDTKEMEPASLIDVTVDLIHETDHAYLVSDHGNEQWIPKSEVHEIRKLSEVPTCKAHEIEIPEWLAEEREFV